MGTDASWPLQQAVIAELKASKELKRLMGASMKIFDRPQPDDVWPRIEIGDSECKAWRSATFDGQEHALALHLWTAEGGGNASKELAAIIIGHLHDADLPLPGHALVDMQFESSETRYRQAAGQNADDTGGQTAGQNVDQTEKGSGVYHCLLQFSALTVSD